jgi:hypothetical protein
MQEAQTTARAPWGQIDRRHFIALGALAAIIGVIAVIQGTSDIQSGALDSDQLRFFFPAAQQMLNGHPFQIYSVLSAGYPNYNPPLATALMAPLLALGQAFLPGAADCVATNYNAASIGDVSCRSLLGFVGLAFIPFVLLLGAATLGALRKMHPTMSQGQALVAYGMIVLSPLTWQNFTIWWHFEQPMMLLFFILGVTQIQSQSYWLGGLLLALAVLTRTTAAVPLVALLAVLATERAWAPLAKVIGMLVVVAGVILGPFFAFDYKDTSFALLQWRSTAPIGNSIWSIFIGTPLNKYAERLDLPVAILVAAGVGYFAVRRLGAASIQRNLYAVLAIAALLVPMLSKTNWPYYYAEPFVFLVIYEFATLHDAPVGLWRWPIISVAYLCAAATLSQFMGMPSATHGGIVLRLMGLIQFATMLVFAILVWKRQSELQAASVASPAPQPNSRPAPSPMEYSSGRRGEW